MKTRFACCILVALVAGCASGEAKDHTTSAHGLQTEVTALVEVKAPPADEQATLAAIDAAVVKLLDEKAGEVIDRAIVRYDRTCEKEQTKVERGNVEIVRETPVTIAETKSATRKDFAKGTHFRFTIRKANAHVVPDPQRIEIALVCLEDSRAPSDTITFPQDFRAELLDSVNRTIFEVARDRNLEPTPPRPAPVE